MKQINIYKPSEKFKDSKHFCVLEGEGLGLVATFGIFEINKKTIADTLLEISLYIVSKDIVKNILNKENTKYDYKKDIEDIVTDFLISKQKEINITNKEVSDIIKDILNKI